LGKSKINNNNNNKKWHGVSGGTHRKIPLLVGANKQNKNI